jgi:hypothetical protein
MSLQKALVCLSVESLITALSHLPCFTFTALSIVNSGVGPVRGELFIVVLVPFDNVNKQIGCLDPAGPDKPGFPPARTPTFGAANHPSHPSLKPASLSTAWRKAIRVSGSEPS